MADRLKQLITAHRIYLPLPEVADFLGMDPSNLRASIEQNRCPFGFSWKIGERSGFKIPTITFLAWYTKGIPVESLAF